jgi:hypothetical protein
MMKRKKNLAGKQQIRGGRQRVCGRPTARTLPRKKEVPSDLKTLLPSAPPRPNPIPPSHRRPGIPPLIPAGPPAPDPVPPAEEFSPAALDPPPHRPPYAASGLSGGPLRGGMVVWAPPRQAPRPAPRCLDRDPRERAQRGGPRTPPQPRPADTRPTPPRGPRQPPCLFPFLGWAGGSLRRRTEIPIARRGASPTSLFACRVQDALSRRVALRVGVGYVRAWFGGGRPRSEETPRRKNNVVARKKKKPRSNAVLTLRVRG